MNKRKEIYMTNSTAITVSINSHRGSQTHVPYLVPKGYEFSAVWRGAPVGERLLVAKQYSKDEKRLFASIGELMNIVTTETDKFEFLENIDVAPTSLAYIGIRSLGDDANAIGPVNKTKNRAPTFDEITAGVSPNLRPNQTCVCSWIDAEGWEISVETNFPLEAEDLLSGYLLFVGRMMCREADDPQMQQLKGYCDEKRKVLRFAMNDESMSLAAKQFS